MTLKRTFEANGFGRDPKYLFAILETWVGLGTDGLRLRAVQLAEEEMHDDDRELLRRFYRCLFDMADGVRTHGEEGIDNNVWFVNLVRELFNVTPGETELTYATRDATD